MNAPSRPALRYHGGKWRLAPWIISHFPPHRVYCEPFAGAASVLLRKPRAYAEILNDLDGEIVNLFRVLRNEAQAARLTELLRLTPFARAEFAESYTPSPDPIEQARRTVARAFMGFGSGAASGRVTGFRSDSNRSGTTPARDWASYPDNLALITARLAGVAIENMPAAQCIAKFDTPDTLHYLDPPYVHGTRSPAMHSPDVYRHEMQDSEHAELLDTLQTVRGAVVLSGYASELYDSRLAGWRRIERGALGDGAAPRLEVLWINPRAAAHARNLFGPG